MHWVVLSLFLQCSICLVIRTDSLNLETDIRVVTKELVGDNGDPSVYELTKIDIGTINYCYFVTLPSQSVVVRISRDANPHTCLGQTKAEEKVLLGLVSDHQVGPRLLAEFDNGLITQRIEGRHLTPEEIPIHASPVAKLVARLHSIPLTTEHQILLEASVWGKIDKWLTLANQSLEHDEYDFLSREVSDLRSLLDTPHFNEKVLIHGDLNHGNIILDPEQSKFALVDFEFSGYGEKLFDLANHFCEHSGLDLNWNLYPSISQQLHFLSEYLRESLGTEPDSDQITQLQERVNKYQLVSHLYWGVWAKLMAFYRPSDPFYAQYGRTRLQRYIDTKEEVLGVYRDTKTEL